MTEPADPEPTALREWLVGCSPSRTLVARRLDGDRTLLVKIYESGSPAEAARELELGQRLAGPGIAAHLETGIDPESGKPCLIQEFVAGTVLDKLLEESGALGIRRAVGIAHGLAEILRRFEQFRDARAPAGLVHGDVKPGNVIVQEHGDGAPTVTLLDLERAIEAPVGDGTSAPGFSGGTHGFAPPESYDGACPTPAFDVFGLGAVLHALLSGAPPFGSADSTEAGLRRAVRAERRRRWLLDGCPASIRALVDRCLAAAPAQRPSAGAVAAQLAGFLAEPTPATDEARLVALRGRPLSALAKLGRSGDRAWRARLARRGRLTDRIDLPPVPAPDAPIAVLAVELEPTLAQLDALLLRFPLHAEARAMRRRALEGIARLAVELPERVASLKRSARFADADALCVAAARAIGRAGTLPRPPNARGARPTPAERDPARVIAIVGRDVAAAASAHVDVQERIREAEARGDPSGVAAGIDALAEMYGGASPVVAAAKDRLHRFEFYLGSVGQQAAMVDDLEPLLAELGIEVPLDAFERFRRTDATRSPVRPRALLRALDDLGQEFRAIAALVAPARAALATSLDAATRRAWEILADVEQKLATPPIPIRPLTGMVARLDRMLQMDVLVDLPDRSRTELHDFIEGLRVKVEQARAERDRITQGAQEAMDRGHLTTAIYDMSRAVDRFGSEGSGGPGLSEQFEEAKRRKREIEDALARNHELAARYADLAADPTRSPAERIAVLHEREHLLSLLCAHLGPERAALYAEDLRAVQLDVLRQHAADGARRLANARDPRERLAIAQRTFDGLQQAAPDAGWNPLEAQEARSLLRDWLELAEEATREAHEQPGPRGTKDHGRRRNGALKLSLGAVGVVTAAALVILALRGRTPDPVSTLRAALDEEVPLRTAADGTATFDAARAVAKLRDFVADLRRFAPEIAESARVAAETVDAVDRGAEGFHAVELAASRLTSQVDSIADQHVRPLIALFIGQVLRAGFLIAALRDPTAELGRRFEQHAELRRSLSAEDADTIARVLER